MKAPRFVIDLLLAVAVGLLGAYLKADGALGLLVGITSLFAIETTRMIPLVEKIYHQYEAVNTLLRELQAPDKFSEILLLHGLKDLGHLSQSSISVSKDDVRNFWRDCLARADTKWSVLTYALADETWGITSWSNKALAIQEERIVSGCTIERVFVVDNIDERKRLQEIMEEHSRRGIKVFWVLKDELLANKAANESWRKIGTLDVAVVDVSWVYKTSFDQQRNIIGASATKSKAIFEAATLLISEAQGLAAIKKNIVQVAIEGGDAQNNAPSLPKVSVAKLDGQPDAEISPGTKDAHLVISGENLAGARISSSSNLISFEKTGEIPQSVEAKISISPDATPGDYEVNVTTSAGAAQLKIPVKHKDAPANLRLSYGLTDTPPNLDPAKDEDVEITISGNYLKGATLDGVQISPGGLEIKVKDNSKDDRLSAVITVRVGTPAGDYALKVKNLSGKESTVAFKVVR
jgi:hypothetical protein